VFVVSFDVRKLAVVFALATLVVAAPASAGVSKADRAGVNALLDKFIPQVLAGKDLKAGKALVGGYVGVDTIQRYPAAGTRFHGWLLNYATPGDVGFDITVQPVNKRKIGAWSFRGEAQKVHGVWKITDWYPVAQFQPLGKAAWVNGPNDLSPGAAGGLGPISRSTTYLFGLGALVAAILLVASALGFRKWLRTRSRVRAIERTLAGPR
jgi:hypothetical protein